MNSYKMIPVPHT